MMLPVVCRGENEFRIKKATQLIDLTGYTRSKTTRTLSCEVSGKALRVNYDIGDRIDKKAFCEIDPTFINLNIKRTRQNIKQLEYNQQRINSRVLYLKKEFERVKNLFKRQSVSEVRMDEASKNQDQAQFELNAVAQEIAARQTTLEELLERKKRHSIYAPKGWSVISKTVEAGDIVSANMVLAKIADFRELVVPLAVSTEELQALKALPKPLDVFLEGQSVKAAIHWVNPEFNETTRKLDVALILSENVEQRDGGMMGKGMAAFFLNCLYRSTLREC